MPRHSVTTNLLIYVFTLLIETATSLFRFLVYLLISVPFALSALIVMWLVSGARAPTLDLDLRYALGPMWIAAAIVIFLCVAISGLLAAAPMIWSLMSYIGLGGGFSLTRLALGARQPSNRETQTILERLRMIRASLASEALSFSHIFILDSPLVTTYTVGTTLYISSGAVRNEEYLEVLLAHELGHVNNGDGGLVLALRRLVFPLFYLFFGNISQYSTARAAPPSNDASRLPSDVYYAMINSLLFALMAFLGGGLGVYLLSLWWANYFRERDYLADQFVVECGLRDTLLEYLEQNRFYDTSVPFLMGWQPANELRIDRLLNPDLVPLPLTVEQQHEESLIQVTFVAFMLSLFSLVFFPLLGGRGAVVVFLLAWVMSYLLKEGRREFLRLVRPLFKGQTPFGDGVRVAIGGLIMALIVNWVLHGAFVAFLFFLALFFALTFLIQTLFSERKADQIPPGSLADSKHPQDESALVEHGDSEEILDTVDAPQLSADLKRSDEVATAMPPPVGDATAQHTSTGSRLPNMGETQLQRRILDLAHVRGEEVISTQDVYEALRDITTVARSLDVSILMAEVNRLIAREYVTLRQDVIDVLVELNASSDVVTSDQYLSKLYALLQQRENQS